MVFLPVAVATNLCSLFDFEKAGIAFRQAWKLPAPKPAGDGHHMGIAKLLVGNKLFHLLMVGTQSTPRKVRALVLRWPTNAASLEC